MKKRSTFYAYVYVFLVIYVVRMAMVAGYAIYLDMHTDPSFFCIPTLPTTGQTIAYWLNPYRFVPTDIFHCDARSASVSGTIVEWLVLLVPSVVAVAFVRFRKNLEAVNPLRKRIVLLIALGSLFFAGALFWSWWLLAWDPFFEFFTPY